MTKTLHSLVLLTILLGSAIPLAPAPVAAQEFAGGDGSEGDPFQIANWTHLNNVRGYLDACFILLNDLDEETGDYAGLADETANSGLGWEPIGTSDNKFTGGFDGQGYEIADLVINRTTEDYVGLFGCVGDGGTVGSLGVADCDVAGDDDVGPLVGSNRGTIDMC